MKKNGAPTEREKELGWARIAGYHDDSAQLVRSLVERKTASSAAIKKAFTTGQGMRRNGVKCHCPNCKQAE